MGRVLVKKPGRMGRAITAWLVLNAALAIVFGVTVYIMRPYMENWYVSLPMLLAFIITETSITSQTIQPIVRTWIDQEEWVDEDEVKAKAAQLRALTS